MDYSTAIARPLSTVHKREEAPVEENERLFLDPRLPREARELAGKIRDHTARVGVMGLGHAGLSLALDMARAGFQVIGIDMDREKVESVNAGISYILDLPSEALLSFVAKERIRATQSLAAVENLDAVSICVPTPLTKTKEPDLTYVIAAVEAVRNNLRSGQLITLDITTYPGTTREAVLPILEKSGLTVGKDFYLAYTAKRLDLGKGSHTMREVRQVVGGITPLCTKLAVLLYQQFVARVVPLSSPECAEMVKLVENTFRSVNMAAANETALMCHKLGIDLWEVIEAAKIEPVSPMALHPGSAFAGHIPMDPYYLSWKAKMNGAEPRLVELAARINSTMPAFTISRIADALNERQKSLNGSKILVLATAYKRDPNDAGELPSVALIQGLHEKGAIVHYVDPYIPCVRLNGHLVRSARLTPEFLQSMNCVVVLTDHASFDYAMVAAHSPLILDCRNALKNYSGPHVLRL